MVIDVQYPHQLKVTYQEGESVKDSNGNWVNSSIPVEIENIRCRIQPNSKGTVITGVDGNKIVFDAIIYVEGRLETIPYEAKVEVFENDELILNTTLLRFSRDSFHSRIWV
ncbi:hypothetical protein [Pedobacter nototheniae]|uniref:hypothetical protein n=1 Tax=Pedobacter nototheniae TaxID=2488994 RepID=UPI00103B5CCD|nr:hypothetical protein [Pedobacter nototheniae]